MVQFTYVVPTTFRFEGFIEQIARLAMCRSIGEIIIVNNSGRRFLFRDFNGALPAEFEKLITIINPPKPSFTNESWNTAIMYSAKKYEYLILGSEEIDYDAHVIDLVAEQIEGVPNLGLLGIDWALVSNQIFSDIGYIYIEEADKVEFEYGALMFLKKSNFIRVPEGIKFLYGDEFLFHRLLQKGLSNYMIKSPLFRIKRTELPITEIQNNRIIQDKKWWDFFSENYIKYVE